MRSLGLYAYFINVRVSLGSFFFIFVLSLPYFFSPLYSLPSSHISPYTSWELGTYWTNVLISLLLLFLFLFYLIFKIPLHWFNSFPPSSYRRECKLSSPVRELYPCDAVGLGENTLSSRPHPHHKVIQYLYTAWVSTQLTSKYSGAQKTTLPPPPYL